MVAQRAYKCLKKSTCDCTVVVGGGWSCAAEDGCVSRVRHGGGDTRRRAAARRNICACIGASATFKRSTSTLELRRLPIARRAFEAQFEVEMAKTHSWPSMAHTHSLATNLDKPT